MMDQQHSFSRTKSTSDPSRSVPICVTIAGSDSSGGAGIQADLKTFSALGVYGASVIAAVTVQNTRTVSAVHDIPLPSSPDRSTPFSAISTWLR